MIAIGLLSFALPAVSADAATYTVWSCRGPDGSPVSTQAWRADSGQCRDAPTPAPRPRTCARLRLPGDSNAGDFRGYTFLTPPGAKIASYRIHLFAATESGSLEENAYQAGLDVNPGQTPSIQFGCVAARLHSSVTRTTRLTPRTCCRRAASRPNGLFVGVKCARDSGLHGPSSVNTLAQSPHVQVGGRDHR